MDTVNSPEHPTSELRLIGLGEQVALFANLHFPIAAHLMPDGWLNPTEMKILYQFAKIADGDILELGSWLGRSTAAIAAGVRDGNSQSRFDTVDFGISSPEEWADKLKVAPISYEKNPVVARAIFQPGGSIAVLIDNIRKAGLLPYVTTVIRGDSTKVPLRSSYGMVFCDTLHGEGEIRQYGKFLDGLLAPGSLLICDDIVDEVHASILKEYIDCEPFVFSNALDKYTKFGITRKRGAQ